MEERIVPHKCRLAIAFNYAHVQAHVDVFLHSKVWIEW